jgi:outer membrane protein
MKSLFVLLAMAFLGMVAPQTSQAQRLCYVDTEYILSRMSDYKAMQEEMNQLSAQWQREYEEMVKRVEEMYKKYQAEKVLLSEDLRLRREQEIEAEEKKNAEYRRKRFGVDGDMFRMREEKVKPIMDKIFAAVEAAAKEKKFDLVVDRNSTLLFLYTNPTYNLSDAVLRRMGYTPGPAGTPETPAGVTAPPAGGVRTGTTPTPPANRPAGR